MTKYLAQLAIIISIIVSLIRFSAIAQSDSDQYVSVSGALNVGRDLYDKSTHRFFGIVKDIDWGKVQVLTASSTRVEGSSVSAAAIWYPRSEITSNYVTKVKH